MRAVAAVLRTVSADEAGRRRDDKDIELCRTTNERISDQAAQLLIENQIPFTRSFIKIPFFLREKYRGAHQFYVIHTNRNRYSQARHTLDHMDSVFRRRLIVSNY